MNEPLRESKRASNEHDSQNNFKFPTTNMARLPLPLSCLFLLFLPQSTTIELLEDKCQSNIPKLEVLPGLGWDALKGEELGRILDITYDQCKTTDDGRYLIPDDTVAITVKTNDFQTNVEIIEHWLNYTSITAQSFRVSLNGEWSSFFFYLGGSFSTDYQEAKSKQVRERAALSRVHVRNTLYRLHVEPHAKLTPPLKRQLIQVMKSISKNQTEKAEFLVDLIVRDYGTHFVRIVQAGAVFVKEDYVSSAFVHANEKHRNQIAAAAQLSFLNAFKFSGGFESTADSSLLNSYQSSKSSQRVRTIGGPIWKSTMKVDEWLARSAENLVAVDRSGDFIHHLVTPARFPNAPAELLKELHDLLSQAVIEYYKYNAHAGCTELDSPNFDYSVNVDDGSCTGVSHNYSFGGTYRTCYQAYYTSDENMCERYGFQEVNTLTGGYNCPDGYTSNKLYTHVSTDTHRKNTPYHKCSGMWWWKKCWWEPDWSTIYLKSLLTTYWCSAKSSSRTKSGYLFGGLYSPETTTNIVTKTSSCPPNFIAQKILDGTRLTICVSNDVPAARRLAIPFAGFSSCENGLKCPDGYTGHLATIIQGCQINYCIHGSTIDKYVTMKLLRPPYRNRSTAVMFDYDDVDGEDVDYGSFGERFREDYEENTDYGYLGIIISCIVFGVIVICVVAYWQKNRAVSYLQQMLHQVPRNELPPPKTICVPNTKKNGPLLVPRNSTLKKAWAPVTSELQTKVSNRQLSIVDL